MGSGGPRGLQILLPGAKTIRGGFDSHTFPPYLCRNREKRLDLRGLIIPLMTLAVLTAGSDCLAQEQAPAQADTTAKEAEEQDWSSENIKELLAQETGDPDIEGSTWKKRKNPRTAMLCSLAFPGLGQIYNEKPFKAVIALGLETYYIMNIVTSCRNADDALQERDSYEQYIPCGDNMCLNPEWETANAWYEEYKERTIDWVWWTSGIVLLVMLDAYVDAHLHDMRFRVETARTGGGTGLAVVVDF
jgi:hypothetical protein